MSTDLDGRPVRTGKSSERLICSSFEPVCSDNSPLFQHNRRIADLCVFQLDGSHKTVGFNGQNRAVDLLKDLFSGVANEKS